MRALVSTILFLAAICSCGSRPSTPTVAEPALQSGECLLVHFIDHSYYDCYETIKPDGHIVLPLTGQVRVAGLTIQQATQSIMAAYKAVGHPTKVSVVICKMMPGTGIPKARRIF